MGYIQQQIIKIAKEKGFVTTVDIAKFYQSSKIRIEMNKLVIKGYFFPEEDCVSYIRWRFKNEEMPDL